MEELEKIRKQKLRELQNAQAQKNPQQDYFQENQAINQIRQLEAQIKSRMTKSAIERFGNIKASDANRAVDLLVILGHLIQQGKIAVIDDKTFKAVLRDTADKKKDFKIIRK